MQLSDDYDASVSTVHGMQKVTGLLALERSRIVIEEEFFVGDFVNWFKLPDGRLLISKDPKGIRIEKISSAYYHLEANVITEEK